MDPDPWDWGVEDVAQFFRDRAAGYTADMPHATLPRLDTFTQSLRQNNVSGFVLLNVVDFTLLQKFMGIESLGVCVTIIHIITKLKCQSAQYVAQHNDLRLQTPSSWPARALPAMPEQEAAQALPSTENVDKRVRSGEAEVEDSHGRKRRKLNENQIQTIARPKNPEPEKAYFGDAKFNVDEIFYGPTPVGGEVKELQPIDDMLVFKGDGDAESDDENFQFQHQGKPAGETKYVYSQMRHFLQAAEVVDLRRQDREAVGILPYRKDVDERIRSATVLQFRHGKDGPIAVRENAAHLEGGYKSPDELNGQTSGEWDFLMQKYDHKEEDALPIYGESDSDEDEDLSVSNDSDAEEGAEEVDESHSLSPARVMEMIDNAVKDCVSKWHDNLPKLESRRAWSIWKQTKQSRKLREMLIQSANDTIDHLTSRLEKWKENFLKSTWQNEQEVIQACVGMEPTVQNREEQRWKISVWKRREEPEHTVHHGKAGRSKSKASRTGLGESSFPVHVDDRFSVSPAPAPDDQPVGEDDEQIVYEADDEQFHTPSNSPGLPPVDDCNSVTTLDDFLVSDEAEDSSGDSKNQLVVKLPVIQSGDLGKAKASRANDDEDAYVPDGEEESESQDLPSPSTFIRKRNSVLPTTPAKSKAEIVDLTMLSSDSSTPVKPGRHASASKKRIMPPPNADTATASEVAAWDFNELTKGNNRLAILIWLLSDAGNSFRDRLDRTFKTLQRGSFRDQLRAALKSVRRSTSENTGLIDEYAATMQRTARMYIQWAIPDTSKQTIPLNDNAKWSAIFDETQIGMFVNMLSSMLQKKSTKLFEHTISTSWTGQSHFNALVVSSSEDAAKPHLTPHNKRKREVKRNQAGEASRKLALDRQARFEESQTADSLRLELMLSDRDHSSIEINPVKGEDDDFVYILDRIAKHMKSHQIDGVRFLWREITGDGQDGSQGCILAHTMGLGKTMQTIAFLVALNEAARSREPSVSEQLPPHLRPDGIHQRQLRILVICPPALIQNWGRELNHWAPGQLGTVFNLDAASKHHHKHHLTEWMRKGGVVLIGYTVFRMMVNKKQPGRARRKNPLSENEQAVREEQAAELESIVLNGPEIVVADEAQAFKNEKSAIAKAVNCIDTESRIALSGTPMSNSVEEIYAMLSWVAPGYLGDPIEFKAHYAEPIAQGLYADSTHWERRKSIVKLKVLHADIQPKVHRANIEALRGSLKPKVEFVITVPLSKTQVELYRRYIRVLLTGGRSEKAKETTVFGWLAYLTLLTNHPWCFREKLLSTPSPKRPSPQDQDQGQIETPKDRSGAQSPNETDSGSATPLRREDPAGVVTDAENAEVRPRDTAAVPTDESPDELEITKDMIQDILRDFAEDMEPQLSSKVTVFLNLLTYSLECGDKALVFTSSIPTLEYLDKLFTKNNKPFGRIDGSVAISKRSQILEDFHNDVFHIMLVSTKAGGVGLNVQAANRVFIFDFGFNPTVEEQAVGRAYRIGQNKPVYVYRFMAGGTFESNIYNKQLFKSSLSQRVVDKKNPRRNAERNTREYLYPPRAVPQEDLREWIGKDKHVLDRLLEQHGPGEDGKIDTMIRTIKTMETLQEEVMDAPLDEEEQKEVNLQIEQGRQRPKGKKAANVAAQGVPSTAPVQPQPTAASFPALPPNLAYRVPPSTFAVPSNSYHNMGGLPVPKGPQPPPSR